MGTSALAGGCGGRGGGSTGGISSLSTDPARLNVKAAVDDAWLMEAVLLLRGLHTTQIHNTSLLATTVHFLYKTLHVGFRIGGQWRPYVYLIIIIIQFL